MDTEFLIKQHKNRRVLKEEFLDTVSSTELSCSSDLQGLSDEVTRQLCMQHPENHGICKTLTENKKDESGENAGEVCSRLLSSKPNIECDKGRASGYSCDESQCSRNKKENKTNRPLLRLRLSVLKNGEADLKWRERERESHKRVDTKELGKEGTVCCEARDLSAKSGFSESCRWHSRYSFRPRPEPRRWHQFENVQKVIKRKPPTRRRWKQKKEIKEKNEEEVREKCVQLVGCARIDFVYRRNGQLFERPQLPLPVFQSKGHRILSRRCDGTRSQSQETSLFIWCSGIHGRGLFTKRGIGEGEVILEFVGEIIRSVIADLREKQYEKKGLESCYMFSIDRELVIDSTLKGWMGRFVNHCCFPNSMAVCVKGRIFVYAVCGIREGEEITMDYGRAQGGDTGRKCCCGAPNCRGTVAV